ncbi:MAG: SDR family oxidoreductase [Candidatus Heimdallarchaeota archaeon]|nr:SDR family oxidoreductase [Candidatus Heimdallarchaeota archaeon]
MVKTLKCDPKLFEKDLRGRIYVVTGANSGSGLETTKQLARQGATVIGACRRVDAGKKAFEKFNGDGLVEIMELDLGSFSSVRRFAENFKEKYNQLDGLVNNAGIMIPPEGRTEDGFETQFGVNHLGHFLLTELLLEILRATAPSRIVNVSSVGHIERNGKGGKIFFDDFNFEKQPYDREVAYSQSKLANILHASELARRLEGSGVSAFSVHPGWIRSNLARHALPGGVFIQNVLMRPFARFLGTMSPFDGAQTTLHCLLDDDAPEHNGKFFSQTSILYPNKENKAGSWPMESPNPNAKDPEQAKKLYDISLKLVGHP